MNILSQLRRYAFRLHVITYRLWRLFSRGKYVDSGVIGIHTKDASGDFVHFLVRKPKP